MTIRTTTHAVLPFQHVLQQLILQVLSQQPMHSLHPQPRLVVLLLLLLLLLLLASSRLFPSTHPCAVAVAYTLSSPHISSSSVALALPVVPKPSPPSLPRSHSLFTLAGVSSPPPKQSSFLNFPLSSHSRSCWILNTSSLSLSLSLSFSCWILNLIPTNEQKPAT